MLGNDNHIVSQKLCGFQGAHCCDEEPVVVAPKFWSFSSHIFSSLSQYVTVKIKVDRSVRKNKFTVNIPFTSKKAMSMLFVELLTCCAFFALGDSGLFHCDDYCFVSGS
jgi:hypothetical protein